MNTPLSRHSALQAADATALAAGLSSLTGTAAHADGTGPVAAPKLATYPRPDGTDALGISPELQWYADEHVTNLRFLTTAEAAADGAA
jgi:hypothetical protein